MTTGPDDLRLLAEEAEAGESGAAARFLRRLVTSDVIVFDRYQDLPGRDTTTYPGPFVWFRAVTSGERTTVPFFSSPDAATEWYAGPASLKTTRFTALAAAVPDGWWACLDPGSDPSKEFSPWELRVLSAGENGVDEAAREMEGGGDPVVGFAAPDEADAELVRSLVSSPAVLEGVDDLRLAQNDDGTHGSRLLLGVFVSPRYVGDPEEVVDRIRRTVRVGFIGRRDVVVSGGARPGSDPVLSALAHAPSLMRGLSAGPAHGSAARRAVSSIRGFFRR